MTVFEITLGQFDVASFTTWPAVLGLVMFVFMVVIVLCVRVACAGRSKGRRRHMITIAIAYEACITTLYLLP